MMELLGATMCSDGKNMQKIDCRPLDLMTYADESLMILMHCQMIMNNTDIRGLSLMKAGVAQDSFATTVICFLLKDRKQS